MCRLFRLMRILISFKPYVFQQEMIDTFHNNRFTICKLPRQSGKSTIMVSYLLHYALFNSNVNIAILANKKQPREICWEDYNSHMKIFLNGYNRELCHGIRVRLELENGSKILASSTSASAVRGGSYNIIFLDEFAYVPLMLQKNFLVLYILQFHLVKTQKLLLFLHHTE